ncbi:hypothetical protein KR074_011499 [Drosophila pseudoananassae]|nr:hypothetical protein KR074_011499 [Drosophila pseudoananassae]
MGKKFCYLEGKATPPTTTSRIDGNDHRGRGDKDQVSGEEDDEDDGRDRMTMFPQQPTAVKRVMSQLAHGYLKLVHRIEGSELDRAVGGMVWERRQSLQSPHSPQSAQPPTEDEISTTSEEYPPRSVGFVDLFRRSLHFEKMGLPVTALELYSMDYLERRKGETRMQGGFLDNHSLENIGENTVALRRKSSEKVTAGGLETRLESSFHSRRLNWKGQTPDPEGKQILKIPSLETENKRDSLLKHKLENQGYIFEKKDVEMEDQKQGPTRNNKKKDVRMHRGRFRSSSPEPVLSWKYAKMNIRDGGRREEAVAPRYKARRSLTPELAVVMQPRNIIYSEEILAERWERESVSSSCSKALQGKSSSEMVMKKTTPRRSCLKKTQMDHNVGSRSSSAGRTMAGYEADSELFTARPSTKDHNQEPDTLVEVWKKTILYCENPPSRGLYRLGAALKYQPIDRLDAGCLKTPLFEEDDDVERTKYFVREFAKLTLEEQRQDLEFRLGQVRLLQDMSDQEYRQHIASQGFLVKPIVNLAEKYPCPFGQCRYPLVTNEFLLGHYLHYHSDTGVQVTESFEDNRLLIVFDPKNVTIGRNACISVLIYGGVRGRRCTLPIRRFMPTTNKDLPYSFDCYEGCLPMFLMIYRNRPESGRRVRFQDVAGHGGTDEDSDDLTMWMMSMDLPQPIHCVMTIFNRRLDASVSSILKVSGLRKSHDHRAVMQSRHYYMRLGGKDLRMLTNNNTEPLYLEVAVKEYAGLFPLRGHSCTAPCSSTPDRHSHRPK